MHLCVISSLYLVWLQLKNLLRMLAGLWNVDYLYGTHPPKINFKFFGKALKLNSTPVLIPRQRLKIRGICESASATPKLLGRTPRNWGWESEIFNVKYSVSPFPTPKVKCFISTPARSYIIQSMVQHTSPNTHPPKLLIIQCMVQQTSDY